METLELQTGEMVNAAKHDRVENCFLNCGGGKLSSCTRLSTVITASEPARILFGCDLHSQMEH